MNDIFSKKSSTIIKHILSVMNINEEAYFVCTTILLYGTLDDFLYVVNTYPRCLYIFLDSCIYVNLDKHHLHKQVVSLIHELGKLGKIKYGSVYELLNYVFMSNVTCFDTCKAVFTLIRQEFKPYIHCNTRWMNNIVRYVKNLDHIEFLFSDEIYGCIVKNSLVNITIKALQSKNVPCVCYIINIMTKKDMYRLREVVKLKELLIKKLSVDESASIIIPTLVKLNSIFTLTPQQIISIGNVTHLRTILHSISVDMDNFIGTIINMCSSSQFEMLVEDEFIDLDSLKSVVNSEYTRLSHNSARQIVKFCQHILINFDVDTCKNLLYKMKDAMHLDNSWHHIISSQVMSKMDRYELLLFVWKLIDNNNCGDKSINDFNRVMVRIFSKNIDTQECSFSRWLIKNTLEDYS